MLRRFLTASCLLFVAQMAVADAKGSAVSVRYEEAQRHELPPHSRSFRVKGFPPGFSSQLRLTLTVSPTGDVVEAQAGGDTTAMGFWTQIEGDVLAWKFAPFEKNGVAVVAEVEEYADLVPPERLPVHHVTPPAIKPDSRITITLMRSGCFGSCPSYEVSLSNSGILFEGDGFVVAQGQHRAPIDRDELRALAKRFVEADFYSMDVSYQATVTDCPTFKLSIEIDGSKKDVIDYMGDWVGMPASISELEDEVDRVSQSSRWVAGGDGLVEALEGEKYNLQSFEAQTMLKEVATRGQTETLRELLVAGVPLQPIASPKPKSRGELVPFANVGWLTAASRHYETLKALIDAGASRNNQTDKDLALARAAGEGIVEGARALIAYGANPNADLRHYMVMEESGGMESGGPGAGSVLIYAADSGNPDMVREILRYRPKLEARNEDGKTAMFAAGEYRSSDVDGARVECVRLLAEAGANVNARDKDGNTPLHETFLTDVEEELLKLGADVNARNKEGETPIFTTVDDDAIPLFLAHGADLSIRNKEGKTVVEAAEGGGPKRLDALRKAIQEQREKAEQ